MSQYFENDSRVKSEVRLVTCKINFKEFNFYSDNGVFSKNGIDFGTRLLLENIIKNVDESNDKVILDVGCGIGVIGIVLAKELSCKCDLIDVNERALNLAEKNAKLNCVENLINIEKSNVYENVKSSYDLIVSNPPIRAGKKVVYEILLNSYKYLNKNGELYFVIRKDQGAMSAKKEVEKVFGNCDIIDRDKGFMILRAKKTI